MKIAIIGSGISGMLAARLLFHDNDIHVFESDNYVGGHTNTVELEAFGRRYAADTGFMVFNERTYPNFVKMLRLLATEARASDMSFSVRCGRSGLEYQGSSLNGLFAQRRNIIRPAFYRMLLDILRFNRNATDFLGRAPEEDPTLEAYLGKGRYCRAFVTHYLVPMGAAIWSARPEAFLQFPARFILSFFNNHGLLTVTGHPQWKTVKGGAREYVRALTAPFQDRIRLRCPVAAVVRESGGVTVRPQGGEPERFDSVVLAAHSNQALAMLDDATGAERDILSAIPYQRNETVLHLDPSLLPLQKRAWASWNYYIPEEENSPVALTYNLNRLQGHRSPSPICISLNEKKRIRADRILRTFVYDHPVYSREALAAQKRLAEINGKNRTYFCGAYWGHGFHEDGVKSALAVGEFFNRRLETC
ncbi:MAG: FAD-dependent oxidoreductase [Acidobacteria bacterium]|nr:FAD-dependent oxidoreductase [Acidobacteriota bacterium]